MLFGICDIFTSSNTQIAAEQVGPYTCGSTLQQISLRYLLLRVGQPVNAEQLHQGLHAC